MTAPAEEALKLQRPLPNGALKVVMTGEKENKAQRLTVLTLVAPTL